MVGFEGVDDGEQVGFDGAVHLGQAGVSVGFGAGDQCASVLELAAVLRQELGGRNEQWACQTRVGVRARFLQRQTAIAVGQRHCRAGKVLLHPLTISERSVDRGVDGLTADIDLLGAFPLLSDGGVGQPGIHRGHGVAGVVEQPSDHFLRHVMVETESPPCADNRERSSPAGR